MTFSRLPYNFEEALAEVKSWRSSHIPAGDIRALNHRIHELEGEVIGYKRMLEEAETAPAAQRKPLTLNAMTAIEEKVYMKTTHKGKPSFEYAQSLIRATEAAHGIKEKT